MTTLKLASLAIGLSTLLSFEAHAEIRIGVAGPFTGANAAVGEQFRRGAEMAAKDINEKGGILGERVELIFGDDASDPRQGISVANMFASEDVRFVIGHYNSGVSIPASEIYAENNILQITPGSTNPTFTERDLWNTFRVCGRDDQQGAVAAQYIIDTFSGKRVAVLHDKTAYGVGIADAVQLGLGKAGVEIALNEGITPGEKDYSALISKMKDAGIEVFYFGGLYTEAGLIVRQADDQGLKAVMVAGDGITSNEFGQIAGPAAEGTLMTFAPDPRVKHNAAAVVSRFRSSGFEPEAYTLYSYAALQVLKQGIEQAGQPDAAKVAELLHRGQPVETVLGVLSFDDKGDRKDEDYAMYLWSKTASGSITYSMIE